MTTLDALRAALTTSGLLLADSQLNEGNRRQQEDALETAATLAALAMHHRSDFTVEGQLDTAQLYAILDGAYDLEDHAIYDFTELFGYLHQTRSDTRDAMFDSLPLPGARYEADWKEHPEAARFSIEPAVLAGPLSVEKQQAYSELIQWACDLAKTRTPWRVGTSKARHTAPGSFGRLPEDLASSSLDD